MKPSRNLGPNRKNGLCHCGCNRAPIFPRKRFFESDCLKRYWIAKYPTMARSALLKRDKGICAVCGLDCLKAWQDLLDVAPMKAHIQVADGPTRRVTDKGDPTAYKLLLTRYGLTAKHFAKRRSMWDCDHILEVVNGGGSCSMENLQTLCIRCHKEKTAALNRRLKCNCKN